MDKPTKSIPIAPPVIETKALEVVPIMAKTEEIKKEEPKAEVKKEEPKAVKPETYRQQQAEMVDQLSNLDYHTQNPPRKLYERSDSVYNKHLPPVYFKSYYLSLAFRAVENDDNNALNAVLSQYNFLNGQNKAGDTILITAVQKNSLKSARILLAKGAYVDATNNRQRTALHYAAALGELEFIKLLLSMGADYTLTDDKDMTAVDYAYANRQQAAAEMIKQYIEQNKLQ